MKQVKVMC